LNETDGGVHEDDGQDDCRVDCMSDHEGDGCRSEQDVDQRIMELSKKYLPRSWTLRSADLVGSELGEPGVRSIVRQSAARISVEDRNDVVYVETVKSSGLSRRLHRERA
jgi:hypothetical protein